VTEERTNAESPVVIKKYANRRLYNTQSSSYVTLDHLCEMVKDGVEFEVRDARTGDDITRSVLTQIIFEEEKKRSQMPLGVLREIIRHGGEAVAGFYAEKAGKVADKRGELKSKTDSLREGLEEKVRGVFQSSPTSSVREAVDELRGKVDTAVKSVVETLGGPAAQAEIDRLQKKVEELETRIRDLTRG